MPEPTNGNGDNGDNGNGNGDGDGKLAQVLDENERLQNLVDIQARTITTQARLIRFYRELVEDMHLRPERPEPERPRPPRPPHRPDRPRPPGGGHRPEP